MKILVTGSEGLLGNALKRLLGENHVYHTRAQVDLKDFEKSKKYFEKCINESKIDTVIHCAALVGGVNANIENNYNFFYENYILNNNVIKICYQLEIKNFINILSTCIFPNEGVTYPLTPSQIDIGPPHSSNFGYSYAKRLSGYETKIIRNITKWNWFSVVPTNIYGPNDNFHLSKSHLIPGMIHRAYLSKIENTDFVIWGNGKPLRQFIHSDDLAKLILWSIENWRSHEYCMLVNNSEISVSDVAKIVAKKFEIPENKIVYDTTKPTGQFRKPAISDITDYKFIELEDGINDTIDWFLENYKNLKK